MLFKNSLRPLALATTFFFLVTLISCGGSSQHALPSPSPSPVPTGSTQLTPTTTVQAETANNASVPDNFARQPNGNAGPGNVSQLPIRSLLYAGSNTKVYAHWLGWFGGSNHMNVGYRSDDAAQVRRQVEDMISRGIQGAIIDWFGAGPSLQTLMEEQMKRSTAKNTPGQAEAIRRP